MSSNVYAWPVPAITPPAVIVGFPSKVDLMTTFARGSDTLTLPVWFIIGDGLTVDSRNALSAVLAGAPSITEVLEGPNAWGTSSITGTDVETLTVGEIRYLSVRWDIEIITSGPMNLSNIMDGVAALITAAGL